MDFTKANELVRAEGIEPSLQAWEAHVLPLYYARSMKGQENEGA